VPNPTDPQSWNRYSYTNNNPLRYTDPTGHWLETVWDIANVVMGAASFADNVSQGNYGAAAVDALGVIVDVGAAVIPVVPGGVGTLIKGARAAENVADVVQAVNSVDNAVDAVHAASYADEGVEAFDDILYRAMKAADDNLPQLGETARTLGPRPDIDIPISNGNVRPKTGGLSVSPNSPNNLPPHRRPAEFNGTGKDPIWHIQQSDLGSDLQYRPDPSNPSGHGFIEPAREMPYDQYRNAISATRDAWTILSNK
jgi:hypothetical protein